MAKKNKKNEKLWGGRFSSETLKEVDAFNASVTFDWKLYPHDLRGSVAHARMLGEQGILSRSEAKKIIDGLEHLRKKIEAGHFEWSLAKEDVHLNIESALIEHLGPLGGKLHTARSRNDQVATDLRLYCREAVRTTLDLLRDFQKALVDQAEKNIDILLPGYTHLQRAQPVSLGHYLLAYFEMIQRDVSRLQDSLSRINVLPLGSGALAGTTFPIDRQQVAKELSFSDITHNSLDGVSDRDFVIETLSHFSLIMMHLSRWAEEWILWTTQEFQFVQLPEGFCTGSSMMPQKMNPDVLELIRGKTGRVYGSLINLLVTMKGLPLAYNKDLQEDKEPLFDAVHTVQSCLKLAAPLVAQTRFRSQAMRQALEAGYVLATDLADYLVTRGVPFREAHHVAGSVVAYCQEQNKELTDLSLEELKKFHAAIEVEVFRWLQAENAVDRRDSLGGTSRELRRARNLLKKNLF